MKKLYLVTGACGHLGSTIVRQLVQQGERVRGFILPQESEEEFKGLGIEVFRGDVRDKASLEPFFREQEGYRMVVIHTAGIVAITADVPKSMYDVNVKGTANIIDLCMEHHISRLVHVSSVHAIPEKRGLRRMEEIRRFCAEKVLGGYAKTKAEATQLVLDSVQRGLDAVVVHPSGIIGPGDSGHNHLIQMVKDYLNGRLPACVRGGYDFVDVRDVANGCILAAEKGEKGECYILSNRHYEITSVLDMLHEISGKRKVRMVLPMWLAKAAAPAAEKYYKLRKQLPLFTSYSLHALRSNDNFSHEKASEKLGYRTRDLYDTLKDTVAWLYQQHLVKSRKRHPQMAAAK